MRNRSSTLVSWVQAEGGVLCKGDWLCFWAFPAPCQLLVGMLRRWDDSQKYLSDNVHLVCEETANYLVIWCIDLEVEEVSTTCPGTRKDSILQLPLVTLCLFSLCRNVLSWSRWPTRQSSCSSSWSWPRA